MAGELPENFSEAGRAGKTDVDGDLGYERGAGAEKVLGLRDAAAFERLLGQARHLLECPREWNGDMPASRATAARWIDVDTGSASYALLAGITAIRAGF
jgi:hypothetical protein